MSQVHEAITEILSARQLALHELREELWKRELYCSEAAVSARIREIKDDVGNRLVQCRKDGKWFRYWIGPAQQELFAEEAA